MTSSISKEEISQLPLEEFDGRILVIQTESDAEKACAYLRTFDVLGFDTETRPVFQKGKTHKIALIQLATPENSCFLFRTNHIGIPDCLASILTDEKIIKVGVSIHDDFQAIRKRRIIKPKAFIDLQTTVRKFGIQDVSLQRIYGILFGKRISKGQRLSNWEADILSEAQKKYAALDAWACLKIYGHLKEIDKA
ncbi:3'-5' exonuclease [Dysgonomonas massiliensis]|uniref:3'-5' exonuclease n=1 Tax=Dysgonomonas massiliensis TaxID=2040292 RepID=UPI000C75D5C7|nr:3'-5' exonuclease [Dysgonomonas massiliensis]